MVSANYIRLFNFFKQYLNIEQINAETFVEGVENIVEQKFEAEKNNFSPRTDIQDLKHQIELLRKDFKTEMELLKQETKTAIAEGNSNTKSDINKLIIWIVSTGIAIVGLLLAFLKL